MRLIDADAYIKYCADKWIPLNEDAVKEQPTIYPVKHGRWIETEEDGDKVVHCSVCSDEYIEVLELASWVKKYFYYCPNCGAKMDEVSE